MRKQSLFLATVLFFAFCFNSHALTISGHVFSIQAVKMIGLPGDIATDANGYYFAAIDPDWSGTITPTKEGFTFTPAQLSFSNVDANLSDQDFYPDPSPPSSPAPAEGEKKYIKYPFQLKWKPGNLAVSYNVYLGTKLSNLMKISNQQTADSLAVSQVSENTTYYWRVDQNYSGASPSFPTGSSGTLKGTVWCFTTLKALDPHLVAWWKFDELNAVTARDYTDNGHTGSFFGNAKIVDDAEFGPALSLDGDGDFVSITGYKGILGSQSRSMTAWVKSSKPSSTILSYGTDTLGNKWQCQIDPEGNLRQGIFGAYVNSSTKIYDRQWHHVAVVFDGSMISQCKLYIDGQQEVLSTVVDKSVYTIADHDVTIGRWIDRDYFQGLIKDVRLYDYALNDGSPPAVIIVDDMESYNDVTNPIYSPDGWQGGYPQPDCSTCSRIGYPPYIKSGNQSLLFDYDNLYSSIYTFSQITKTFPYFKDWSFYNTGKKILTIPFRGFASNIPDRLFVALEDTYKHSFEVYFKQQPSGLENPDVLRSVDWQNWQINLDEFKNHGVDLTSIKKIILGVGTRFDTFSDDWIHGTLVFDDITLNKPYCRPDLAKPAGDINNDCIVNFIDIQAMASNWLAHDIVTDDPTDANLLVRYTFDQNTASDSSSNHFDGTSNQVGFIYDSNSKGTVAQFNGTSSYISVPVVLFDSISDQITISFWAFGDQNIAANSVFYGDTGSTPRRILNAHLPWINGSNFAVYFDAGNDPAIAGSLPYDRISLPLTTANLYKGKWDHWAFTKDNSSGQMKIYCNGLLLTSGSGKTRTMSGVQRFDIGRNPANIQNSYFKGLIDDFRIYDKALSDGQIIVLAGYTHDFIIPIDPLANLKADGLPGNESIDYRDFSVLADTWLQTKLWP